MTRSRFRELHAREQLFVMPNPWDVGSAKLLASCGFEALATTSAGFAWSLGKLDQNVSRAKPRLRTLEPPPAEAAALDLATPPPDIVPVGGARGPGSDQPAGDQSQRLSEPNPFPPATGAPPGQ